MADITLILGGARSGKSAHGERLALAHGLVCVYVATAQAFDDEMRDRIAQHRIARGHNWITVDAPVALPEALRSHSRAGFVVLVDCLTLWLTNLMLGDHNIQDAFADLERALDETEGPVILVSNEVGLGIVPDNRLARDFRDHAGRLHQRLAARATRVEFIAAGLPLTLKG